MMKMQVEMGYSLSCMVLVLIAGPLCALGQLPCASTPVVVDDFFLLNTTAETVNMSCPIPTDVVLSEPEQFRWEWLRLAPGNTLQNQITSGITSGSYVAIMVLESAEFTVRFFIFLERNVSIYSHPVECTSSGFYQAFYRNASDECLFSCYFVISEVRETRIEVLRDDFAAYRECRILASITFIEIAYSPANGTVESSPSNGSSISRNAEDTLVYKS